MTEHSIFQRFSLFISPLFPCLAILLDANNYYIVISIFISTMIIFWNFPILSKILHMRPLYYEDLMDDTNVPELNNLPKERFQNIFTMVQMFILAIAFSVLFDYIMVRIQQSDLKFIEMCAFIGGFITIYQKSSTIIGKIIITLLFWKKKKEISACQRESHSLIDIICVEINDDDDFELNMDMDLNYDRYHKYMLNNMSNQIILNSKDSSHNGIVNLKLQELEEKKNDILSD